MARPALLVVVALATVLVGCGGGGDPVVAGGDLAANPPSAVDVGDTAEDEADEDGTTEEVPGDDMTPSTEARTFEDACAGRDDEAFIEVLTPVEDTTVSTPLAVTGCGNTFEATYRYRLETGAGELLTEGFGTMTCGNGCVGEFELELDVDATGEAVLVVFESSAEDGSMQHTVEVPITIG